jgi:4'-phosphopantetheinyl transferase
MLHWATSVELPDTQCEFPDMANDVDVWRISKESGTSAPTWLLCAEELDYARRFHNPLHARRWACFRAALREIVSLYCNTAAAEVCFRLNAYGKPALDGHADIYFNQSHSQDLSVVCVSTAAPVGIDVEQTRPLYDMESLAQQVFSPAEIAALNDLPVYHRKQLFYDIWTRKEAVLKADGRGLSVPPTAVELGGLGRSGWERATLNSKNLAEVAYRIYRLDPGPNYAGALALEVPHSSLFTPPNVRHFEYPIGDATNKHPSGANSSHSDILTSCR